MNWDLNFVPGITLYLTMIIWGTNSVVAENQWRLAMYLVPGTARAVECNWSAEYDTGPTEKFSPRTN
jgi:hypothetical protein